MLQNETNKWWKGTKRVMTAQVQAGPRYISWERFNELFNEKYLTLSLRMANEKEFMDLK